MKKIYFICVNYNNAEITIKYIQSIHSLVNEDFFKVFIIIVDNNSEDIEKEVLLKWQTNNPDKPFHFLPLNHNIGYFPAINKGLKFIELYNGLNYIIVGNNDLIFDVNFLLNLCNNKYDDNVFVIAPNIIRSDGLHQNPFFITRISFLRKLYYKLYYLNYYCACTIEFLAGALNLRNNENNKPSFEQSQYIYMGFGACYILAPVFLKECIYLKDDVFLFGEEAMLAYQIKNKNGKIFYDSTLIVHHSDHSSINKIPSRKIYRIAKKSFKIYRKYL